MNLILDRSRINKQLVELKDAAVAFYANTPGKRDVLQGQPPSVVK